MPAFGFLLILIGAFVLINVFNGNLQNVALGNLQFNFTSSPPPPTSSPTAPAPVNSGRSSGNQQIA